MIGPPEAAPADGAPRILFLALADDVGSDRVVADVGRHGALCAVMAPPGYHCAATQFAALHIPLPRHRGLWRGALAVRGRLEAALRDWSPDLVVPLDDMAGWLLRSLAADLRTSPALRELLRLSLGAVERQSALDTRLGLMVLARDCGVAVPEFGAATEPSEAPSGFPIVVKLDHTCGGAGISIVPDTAGLRAALAADERRRKGWIGQLRQAAKAWLWRRAGSRTMVQAPPLLQGFIPGRPAMHTVAAWQGRVLAGFSLVAESVHPEPTGASTAVRHVQHTGMAAATASLVRALGCSGLVSCDFVLREADGLAVLIEMNARPVGSGHLGRVFGQDLVEALLAALRGRPLPVPQERPEGTVVALFPKELARDPDSPRLQPGAAALHDVPWDDPPLIAHYLGWLGQQQPRRMADIRRRLGQAETQGRPGAVGATRRGPAVPWPGGQGAAPGA